MYLEFKQTQQELYSASFDIMEGENKVGQASIQGWVGGAQGNWEIEYKGRHLFMGPIQEKEFKKSHPDAFHPWRPQVVKEGGKEGSVVGYQYQVDVDQGLLKNLFFPSDSHVFIEIDGEIYEMFGVDPSLQDNGKMCFYDENNTLVTMGETPHDVFDGMHNYSIIASEEKYVMVTIIQICKAYAVSGFNPGKKIKKGHEVNCALTKDKELLKKYDPEFERKYGKQ